jgi:hypothetical protein
MAQTSYALSIKQPWAALLVQGRKTIEIRRWPTQRRGRILLHAARIPDARAEAWRWVPDDLRTLAAQVGGIVGAAELADCREYRTRKDFEADCDLHLNDPAWWHGGVLYGFVFTNMTALPFRPYSGWVRFFSVDEESASLERK